MMKISTKLLRLFPLLVGVAFFLFILRHVDLPDVLARLAHSHWSLMPAVLCVFGVAYFCDTAAWYYALPSLSPLRKWWYRLWQVRMAGAALNTLTPLVPVSGEPVKAYFLNRRLGVNLSEALASVVASKTVTFSAAVLFVACSLPFVRGHRDLAMIYDGAAAIGVLAAILVVILAIQVQRLRLLSYMTAKLAGAVSFVRSLNKAVPQASAIDEYLANFYKPSQRRLWCALSFSVAAIGFGGLEIYAIFALLGQPVTFPEALAIEAVLILVGIGTIFIPANLGAYEAVFLIMSQGITGSAELGITVAVVRRCRELFWLSCGALCVWRLAVIRNDDVAIPSSAQGGSSTP